MKQTKKKRFNIHPINEKKTEIEKNESEDDIIILA